MKNSDVAMKKIALFTLLLLTFLISTSCQKPSGAPAPLGGDLTDETLFPTDIDIEKYTLSAGNPDSNIVLLLSFGGPRFQSPVNTFMEHKKNNDNIHWVLVDQFQALYPDPFLLRDLSIFELDFATEQTVELLYNAAQYYKKLNKQVVIAGGSYGAFIIQKLIAEKGLNTADKYLIFVGRFRIQEEIWKEFYNGYGISFGPDGLTPLKIHSWTIADEFTERNRYRMIGIVGKIDYIELLEGAIADSVNQDTIFYAYGTNDTNVGTMLPAEIQFMTRKAFTVYRDEKSAVNSGDHASAGSNGLKEVFRRGFLPPRSPFNLLVKNDNEKSTAVTSLSAQYTKGSTLEFYNGNTSLGTASATSDIPEVIPEPGNIRIAELTLDPPLSSAADYHFKVKARTADGHISAFSEEVIVTVSPAP